MAFCENCGAQINENSAFCDNCGAKISGPGTEPVATGQTGQPVPASVPVQQKNPIIALILSLVICGVGQMYNGHWKKGVLLFFVFIVLLVIFWPLALIVWLFGMYDAYTTAQKINNGENVPDLFSK
jgi:TM2 domain-containing membrane protein YozV